MRVLHYCQKWSERSGSAADPAGVESTSSSGDSDEETKSAPLSETKYAVNMRNRALSKAVGIMIVPDLTERGSHKVLTPSSHGVVTADTDSKMVTKRASCACVFVVHVYSVGWRTD